MQKTKNHESLLSSDSLQDFGVEVRRRFPSVTIIISAFNEEAVIGRKLENALELSYPELVEIIVVTDGCTDLTADIVRKYCAKQSCVKLIELENQSGKSMALNEAVPKASGDLIVFTDANAMFSANALLRLVAPFSSNRVGYTVGSALYFEDDLEAVNVSEGLYWRYELLVKKLESNFHSVVGGDGAIYAIRASLFSELQSYDISDFVNPLQIAAKGYRGIFVSGASTYEHGTTQFSDEFKRKRRIVNRSWGAVRRNFGLFSWKRHPKYLFMLISHKVVRWWAFPLIIMSVVTGLILVYWYDATLYATLLLFIVGTIFVAGVGWILDNFKVSMPKSVYLFYYFYLVNFAAFLGMLDEMRGRRQSIWQPLR